MESKSSLCHAALPAYDIGCDGKPIPKESVKGTEANPLDVADLSDELKKKIGDKAIELVMKFPHMKRDRLMKKAGEFYKVKFIIE